MSSLKLPPPEGQLAAVWSALHALLYGSQSVSESGLLASNGGLSLKAETTQDMAMLSQDVQKLESVLEEIMHTENGLEERTGRIQELSSILVDLSNDIKNNTGHSYLNPECVAARIREIIGAIKSLSGIPSSYPGAFFSGSQHLTVHGGTFMSNVHVHGDLSTRPCNRQEIQGPKPRALKAAFDSEHRELCCDETRAGALSDIARWIGVDGLDLGTSKGDSDSPQESIYWVNGPAGTGKTTIAATVAHACSNRSILGASFFCSRGDAECSDSTLVFTTIADQLGQFNPDFAAEVFSVRLANPDIGHSFSEYQLRKLIVEPLRLVRHSLQPCVIIIDALDECKDPAPTSTILTALSTHAAELAPLKFLVTSRPEVHITRAITSEPLNTFTRRLHLHEVELGVVRRDIEHYLEIKLSQMARGQSGDWPSAEEVRALANLSSGLFIFASTAVKFIDLPDFDPKTQLTWLIQNVDVPGEGSPTHRLDRLYTEVLSSALPNVPQRIRPHLRYILGSLVLLRGPLSLLAFSRLLDLDIDHIRRTLLRLQSVILIPTDLGKPIRLLHPSFFDFISSPTRCSIQELSVDVPYQNAVLAERCLTVLIRHLHRDMCRIGGASRLNCEVLDLPDRIGECIPLEVQYACRHWVSHIVHGSQVGSLLRLLDEFVPRCLLYWIEVCSLLGDLRHAVISVSQLHHVLIQHQVASNPTIVLLKEAERFIRAFFPVISTSALQVYHSALLFTPTESTLRNVYGTQMDLAVRTHNAVDRFWRPCLQIISLRGHVKNLSVSPDGNLIASVSEQVINLWDALTGTKLMTLVGQCAAFSHDGSKLCVYVEVQENDDTDYLQIYDIPDWSEVYREPCERSITVHSLAWFPDGSKVIFCADGRIRIWDLVNSRQVLLPLPELHSEKVLSMAFSRDGARIVSGSHGQIHIWDANNGALVENLHGHSDWVTALGFSHDGSLLASASDKTIQLWKAHGGTKIRKLRGHTDSITSLAFSPDSKQVVSGSDDQMVYIWDSASGGQLHKFRGHLNGVYSVVFSPVDHSQVFSGSADGMIRIWAVPPERTQPASLWSRWSNKRRDHTGRVLSLAFCAAGPNIVSGSDDGTMCIWDTSTGDVLQTIQAHSDWIWAVAFSHNSGRYIVSASRDTMLHVWDTSSGAGTTKFKTLVHPRSVSCVAFSPTKENSLATGCWDSVIRIWDFVDGTQLQTLRHSSPVISIAYSPDGLQIASGSSDGKTQICNISDGWILWQGRDRHDSLVRAVAFSPSGTRVISGDESTLRIWDAGGGILLDEIEGHSMSVPSVAGCINPRQSPFDIHIDSSVLLTTHAFIVQDEWLYCFSHKKRICWVPRDCRSSRLCVSADGNRVAFGMGDGRVVIFDFRGFECHSGSCDWSGQRPLPTSHEDDIV
ncbi:quinon protein alcohol dehydrogenase-like superfamily [Roridomyces roridus]|uniref:Quinon protein alcohol dehydrogenase-like superfamily n=1 Tax=Roridomyces roridus TaxID=1738132 RepID=A0AAD7B5B8_9AGAR|nr:quinon protein alcohol dehydrogenase-like superfamily [Roridomyces roridus]